MIKEALQYLADLGKGISETKVVQELTTPNTVVFMTPDGTLTFKDRENAQRSHQVQTFKSFAAAVHRFGTSALTSIWVSESLVKAILNDSEGQRQDAVKLPLTPHHAFKILAGARWMEQKELIDLLRHDLIDCDISPDSLLPAVKSLKFSQKISQSGEYTNTSVGLGKDLSAEVTGAVALPDTVLVDFHPYPGMSSEVDVNVSVACTLFSDPVENRLKLEPQPGSLEEAWRIAMEEVSATLTSVVDNDMPILIGTP